MLSQSSGRCKEDQSVISNRKNIFAKFARLNIKEAEKRRLAMVQEEKPKNNASKGSWLAGTEQDSYDEQQLAYTEPYKALYAVPSSHNLNLIDPTNADPADNPEESTDQIDENSAVDESTALRDQEFETASTAASVASSSNDTLCSMRFGSSRRGRLMHKTVTEATARSASIRDFDKTSTALQPTEIQEYTSNLNTDDIRRKFFLNYKINQDLPIYHQRSYLINSINSYSVVIIEGATGCGKTTQVPMYIVEDAILTGRHGRAPVVYVTQPRRIAARSVASRVCDEHNWALGSIVGYQVGLDRVVTNETVLVFCTAGVLLQKLIQDKSLASYTHIIIDEAHERDADTDLLLMMIRTLMRKENSFFRLVVMSATMDLHKLKSYFTFRTVYGHKGVTTPSIVKIDGREPKPITIVYYDTLKSTFGVPTQMPTFNIEFPELYDECLEAAKKIILDVIPHLDTFSGATESTLVFLPGLAEISRLHRMLKGSEHHIDVILLHSTISHSDQNKAFLRPRAGCRKVILATNIAESSITVKDVGFIIDFCLTKSLRKDSVTNFPALKLHWSTVDKSTQRAGRTGRCCPGKVFRMVTAQFFKEFSQYSEPELLTAPLELSVLRVKRFQMGEVKSLFAVVLDPPPFNEIRSAVLELKQIGALSSTFEGKISDIDGDLTELGKVISNLPIDVHLGKLIVMAYLLDVLEPAIIVAACLSTNRTVVRYSFEDRAKTYKNKLKWARGSDSDLIVSLEVYKEYILFREKRDRSQKNLEHFCDLNGLDERKLHDVEALHRELVSRLEAINIKEYDQPNRVRNEFEDELMLKVAFCASFYPNYFLTEDMDVAEIKKTLGGFDPRQTVLVHNLPVNQVPLYRTQIIGQLMRKNIAKNIDYIADCSRALLVLNDGKEMLKDNLVLEALQASGVVEPSERAKKSVYKALKFAEYENKIIIREYKEDAAEERMRYYSNARQSLSEVDTTKLLPSWIKVVVGRPADNRVLFEANDEEYFRVIDQRYYLEIELNDRQDSTDLDALYDFEEKWTKANRDEDEDNLNQLLQHPIYKTSCRLVRGPTSPVQMIFRSVLDRSKGFKVDVEPMSVNSILLNPDFEKPRRQMMVAASVCQSRRNRVVAHDTTLLPNITGLPTLMALMFAQYYRVIYNEQTKCIVGGVFGLGWNEDDAPIDRNYEVELGFDIHITNDDIALINEVRRGISKLIKFTDVKDAGAPRAELQQRLRSVLLTIIKKRRCSIEETPLSTILWGEPDCEFYKDIHNVPPEQLERLGDGDTRSFLPIMKITKEYTEKDMYESIRKNLDHLTLIEKCEVKPPLEGIRCLLCGFRRENIFMFQTKIVEHLYSDSHISKLETFEKAEERLKARTNID